MVPLRWHLGFVFGAALLPTAAECGSWWFDDAAKHAAREHRTTAPASTDAASDGAAALHTAPSGHTAVAPVSSASLGVGGSVVSRGGSMPSSTARREELSSRGGGADSSAFLPPLWSNDGGAGSGKSGEAASGVSLKHLRPGTIANPASLEARDQWAEHFLVSITSQAGQTSLFLLREIAISQPARPFSPSSLDLNPPSTFPPPLKVLPERRLLVCGIEGAAADVFADLLCSLGKHHPVFAPVDRGRTDGGRFEQGCSRASTSPQAAGLRGPSDMAAIFADPTWTRAVWFRDPLDRFLAAWR